MMGVSMAMGQTTGPATQKSELAEPQRVTYTRDLAEVPGYFVAPKGEVRGAVLLVHDIFGVSDFMRGMANELAQQGYAVLMPDLYARYKRGDGNKPVDPLKDAAFDAKTAWLAYEATPDAQIYSDLLAAVNFLSDEHAATKGLPLAVVGHDMGGGYAMRLAGTDLRVKAAVNYYGRIVAANMTERRPISPVDSLFNLRAPLLSFYGEIDPQVPADHVKQLESRLVHNPNKTSYQLIKYPNVGHSFLVPTRPGYDKASAEDAMRVTREFLARTLVKEKPEAAEGR